MTFDEFCGSHEVTPHERAALVNHLAHLRADRTRAALSEPKGTGSAPATSDGGPRCKTCGDTGWVTTYDQIEPGIAAPSGEPCPDCEGPSAPPAAPGGGTR
jgi:DnaJ-class molecular chaperone